MQQATTSKYPCNQKSALIAGTEAPGVRCGAKSVLESAHQKHVPWAILDRQLAGIDLRRGRKTVWEGKATETMETVRAQTLSGAQAVYGELRIPEFLTDPSLDLSAAEQKLCAAVWRAYENGWGGLYDNQINLAVHLGIGTERTLRNLLNGRKRQKVRRAVGGRVVDRWDPGRAGLEERGLIRKIRTWAPAEDGGSRQHCVLMRIGPELERLAGVLPFAKGWITLPRRRGVSRRRARQTLGILNRASRTERYRRATTSWETARKGREAPPERARPPAKASSGGGVSPVSRGGPPRENARKMPARIMVNGAANSSSLSGPAPPTVGAGTYVPNPGDKSPAPLKLSSRRSGCSKGGPPRDTGDTPPPEDAFAGGRARSGGGANAVPGKPVRKDARRELRRAILRAQFPDERLRQRMLDSIEDE